MPSSERRSRANASLGFYLTPLGCVDLAIVAARCTVEIDPRYGDYVLGWVYLRERRFDDAVRRRER
jgi:hypothetical protein